MELVNSINSNLNNISSLDSSEIKKIQNIIKNNILQTIVKYDVTNKKEQKLEKKNLDVNKLKLKELQDLCIKYKLKKYGTKSDLIERLNKYFNTSSNSSNTTCDSSNTTCDSSNTTCDSNNTNCDSNNTNCDSNNTNYDSNNTNIDTISTDYINNYFIKNNDIRKINNINEVDINTIVYKNFILNNILDLIKNNITNNKNDINKSIKNELINISNINNYNNEFKNILKNCEVSINNIIFIGYINYNDTFLISTDYSLININNDINYNGYLSFEININNDSSILYILSELIHNINDFSLKNDNKENNYNSCLEYYKNLLILFHI